MTNLLMSRIYFFIPLDEVEEEYKNLLRNSTQRIKGKSYIDFVKYEPLKNVQSDFEDEFVFSVGEDTFKVHVNTFLIGFRPSIQSHRWIYLLVVGTDLGNMLDPVGNSRKRIVREEDIVKLKNAFKEGRDAIDPSLRKLTQNDKRFADWLYDDILPRLTSKKCKEELLYSHTEIRIAQAERLEANAPNYDSEFAQNFFAPESKSISDVLGDKYPLWAYGLLYCDNSYEEQSFGSVVTMLPVYKTSKSDILYSVNGNILFIQTHYPFPDSREVEMRAFKEHPFVFDFLPFLFEFCITLHKDYQMRRCLQKLSNMGSIRIRKKIAELHIDLHDDLFHRHEFRHILRFFNKTWYLDKLLVEIKETGSLYSEAHTQLITWILSIFALFISILTFLLNSHIIHL